MQVISKTPQSEAVERRRLANEIAALTDLSRCPYLPVCHHAFETAKAVFLVQDFLGGGDLFTHLVSLAIGPRA